MFCHRHRCAVICGRTDLDARAAAAAAFHGTLEEEAVAILGAYVRNWSLYGQLLNVASSPRTRRRELCNAQS